MARRRPPQVHGVVIVDKPAGVTSHDVVAQLRKRFSERRIGHAGTLDPDATGVLVVAVGSATRLLRYVGDTTKRYTGEVVFGVETDTLDAAGQVTATHDMDRVDLDEVRRVIAERFIGPIQQIPPMVSAIRVDGRRLHELAREGIEVEREPRSVAIQSFDVAGWVEPGVLEIDIRCSSGTYIRTLAADLGRALGGGAHLRNLRRSAVGSFTLAEAAPPESADLLAVRTAVRDLEQVSVDEQTAARVGHGRMLDRWPGSGPWAVSDPDGELIAVYEAVDERSAKPAVVLSVAR
jgi:tRNA pseudouridine55 synthase